MTGISGTQGQPVRRHRRCGRNNSRFRHGLLRSVLHVYGACTWAQGRCHGAFPEGETSSAGRNLMIGPRVTQSRLLFRNAGTSSAQGSKRRGREQAPSVGCADGQAVRRHYRGRLYNGQIRHELLQSSVTTLRRRRLGNGDFADGSLAVIVQSGRPRECVAVSCSQRHRTEPHRRRGVRDGRL